MLTRRQNPLVKQIHKLHSRRYLREEELFLLEGTHLLEEACAVDSALVTVCCTSQWQTTNYQLSEAVCQGCDRAELVSPEVLKAIAATVQPD